MIWGNAAKTHLHELTVQLNNLIRIITHSSKYTLITNLYKNLNIIKLTDIYVLEVAKYIHQLHNNKLPKLLYDDYVKIN